MAEISLNRRKSSKNQTKTKQIVLSNSFKDKLRSSLIQLESSLISYRVLQSSLVQLKSSLIYLRALLLMKFMLIWRSIHLD